MKKISIIIIGLAIAIISCNNEKPSAVKNSAKLTMADGEFILTDSLIYGIATHASENIDSSELVGFSKFLKEKLIDYIFQQVYAGKLTAYDFFSEKELSIHEVKELEKMDGFNRSKVGKVQFDEQWLIDKNGVLIKRVNSMTLGIEHFSNQGNFIGYNALFKIKFNATAQ